MKMIKRILVNEYNSQEPDRIQVVYHDVKPISEDEWI